MASNTVELVGTYGGDVKIALSAWTSTHRDLTDDKILRIPNLLNFLVKGSDGKSHETPFEKSMLHFIMRTDIATHIHILKHRIGVSTNTESARYKELVSDTILIPDDWPIYWQRRLKYQTEQCFRDYHECLESLVNEHGFDKKRAKESARFFNPYATQLTADVAFNFRSFVNFCKLRAVPGAQKEVRDIAKKMIELVDDIRDNPESLNPSTQSPFHYSIRSWKLNELVGRE